MSASVIARIAQRGLHTSARRLALTKMAMPAMSPTMTEGGISKWKVEEGGSFAAGDVLLEIETDKAVIDVEAQDDGVLAKIISADGSKNVGVGAPIAILAEPGDDLSAAAQMAEDAKSEGGAPPPPPKEESAPAPPKQDGATDPANAPTKTGDKSGYDVSPKTELPKGDRIYASPVAKKIALERGIPLAKVKGTGPEGRILREDVEKYKPESAAPSAASPAVPEYTDIPTSSMRRTIGQRLQESKVQAPHYYVTVDINMDKVIKLREAFNKSLAEKDKGAKLSVNDFIVKAVAKACEDVPEANSAWLGENIRQYNKVDVSIAVATPNGLITPIVKDVGAKGLATLSAEAKTLAKKARDGKLAPQEYQGGTFTVSNLGMFDVSHFTAIINPPQSCILAVGSTQPTLVPAPETEQGFKTVNKMNVTLSSDHRTVDGALAARWLGAFKGYLENPLTFML
ncbi:pyruvate dehydrogenase [Peniophora sp. CONT]|nr:pyruvate dehydrogenase [Peniophora sp. CONT]